MPKFLFSALAGVFGASAATQCPSAEGNHGHESADNSVMLQLFHPTLRQGQAEQGSLLESHAVSPQNPAPYHLGIEGSDYCSTGEVSEEDCEHETPSLMPTPITTFRANNDRSRPPGCSIEGNNIYYNNHHLAHNDGSYTPVCTGSAIQPVSTHLGIPGSDHCSTSSVGVESCLQAARYHSSSSASLSSTSSTSKPPGCSIKHTAVGRNVYYNTENGGHNNGDYTPVCDRGGSVHDSINEMNEDRDSLREDHEALQDDYTAVIGQHEALREEHDDLQSGHNALSDEHEALSEDHNDLSAEHEALRGEHDAQAEDIADLGSSVDDLTGRHDQQASSINEMNEDHDSLRDDHEALQGDYTAVIGQHEALREEHDDLRSGHNALSDEHEALRDDHNDLSAEHEALRGEHDAQAEDIADLASSVDDLNDRHDQQANSITDLQERFEALESSVAWREAAEWQLVMKSNGDETLGFSSAYWTDSVLLNEQSPVAEAGNAKYAAFNDAPVTHIRICIESSEDNCFEHTLLRTGYFSSARSLFSAGYIADSTFDKDDLLGVLGESPGRACAMEKPGFNIECPHGNKARFGFCNNVPDQGCQTNLENPVDSDAALGIGLMGQASREVGAGWTHYGMGWGRLGAVGLNMWLWVK